MKRWMTFLLALAMAAGLLSACGGGSQPPAVELDFQQFYADVEEACGWGEGYMVEIEGEMLDAYYPGLGDLSTRQLLVMAPMMSAVVNEVAFVECETEEDADKAAAILQARIDYQVGDEDTPGGAWYPESIAAWEKGEVIRQGTYVAMVASASYQDEIVSRLKESLGL